MATAKKAAPRKDIWTKDFRKNIENSIDALEANINEVIDTERKSNQNEFSSPSLLRWTLEEISKEKNYWITGTIGTIGSGPWNIEELDSILIGSGFSLSEIPNDNIEVLVIGREDYSQEAIEEHINSYADSNLVILSQELLVAGLIRNANPLDEIEEDELLQIAENHAGLDFILSLDFEWPINQDRTEEIVEWEHDENFALESPLKAMGYSVRQGGPSEEDRREILENFYYARTLPLVETDEAKRRWGKAGSNQRLYSMSVFISWLIRFLGSNSEPAKIKWQTDLAWLKSKFYRQDMRFGWPKPQPNISSAIPNSRLPIAQTKLNPQAAWPFPTQKKP